MFVDGKSIKWEMDGRRLTADELLAAAVWAKASAWTNWGFVEPTTEELAERIWNEDIPTPDEISADSSGISELNDTPDISSRIRRSLSSAACYYCGANREMAEAMHTDHVRPRSRGGRGTAENKVQACKNCNLRKSDGWLGQFRGKMAAEYGFEQPPTFFGELPEVRRVLKIETQTAKALHPDLRPAEDHPLTRMGTSEE